MTTFLALALISCDPPPAVRTPDPVPALLAEINATLQSVVGTTISFADGGNGRKFRISGWTGPESGMPFTWTMGHSAKLSLPIPGNSSALGVNVAMGALTNPPQLPFQAVQVYANGHKVADFEVSKPAQFAITIPGEIASACGLLDLEFRIPNAASPSSLGHSGDARVLGIFISEMSIAPLT